MDTKFPDKQFQELKAKEIQILYNFYISLLIGSAKKKKKSSKKSSGFDKDTIIGTATIKVTVS